MNAYKSTGEEKRIIVKKGTWLLAFYLLLAPLDFLPVIHGVSISKILILIPLSTCLFCLKNMKIRLDKFLAIPVLYFLMVMVSMLYSYDISDTKQRVISIGLNILVIIVLTMLKYNQKEIKIIKKAIVYSGWLTLLLIVFYSNTSLIEGRVTISINGSYQDPNYLTGFLIFSINYYFEDFIQNKNKTSIAKVSIFLVFVILTGSRGGLIAIIGSILFYCLIWMKAKKLKPSSIVTIISIIIIIAIFFKVSLGMIPESVAQRFTISFTLNDRGAKRFDVWKSIIYNYRNSPEFNKIFGWGAGTIRYFTCTGNVGHNIWIESLMEIGILGVTILFIYYFIYFIKALKIKETNISASFMGYMIMAMSLSLYSYKPIWNIILLIMILKNSNYNERKYKSKDNQFALLGACNED